MIKTFFNDRQLASDIEHITALTYSRFDQNVKDDPQETLYVVGDCFNIYDPFYPEFNSAFGIGLSGHPVRSLFTVEEFYEAKAVEHFNLEITSLVDQSFNLVLIERGYVPNHVTSVMVCPLDQGEVEFDIFFAENVARQIEAHENKIWLDTVMEGWGFVDQAKYDFYSQFVKRADTYSFIFKLGEISISSSNMLIKDGLAILLNSSTIPRFRNKGAHTAMHSARLKLAQALGCKLALISVMPASIEEYRAEKFGFIKLFTRTNWSNS